MFLDLAENIVIGNVFCTRLRLCFGELIGNMCDNVCGFDTLGGNVLWV